MNESKNLQEILKPHQTLIVVGANWGDEGKGKVIDKVMENFDIVARFSGGANAGHTVFTPEGKKLVSHLIPTGLAQNKICVLSRGEFFNLELFVKELQENKVLLEGKIPPIYIDEQAPLWTPYHGWFESYVELARGQHKLGTTNKGIGPLEGFYKLRLGVLVGHLFKPELLKSSLEMLYNVIKPCLDQLRQNDPGVTIPSVEEVHAQLVSASDQIKDFVSDTSFFLNESLQAGQKILFEGAQATGLDAFWGTYPFVSSGNSVAAGASIGTGLSMTHFSASILVAKALPTRVGNGPFPSEMWQRQQAMDFAKEHGELFTNGKAKTDFLAEKLQLMNSGKASGADMSQYFQVLGDERGATTGRGRSVGYLDIPWLLYAIRINKPTWMALTRFDMLSGVKSVPVVVNYKFNGEILPPGKLPPPWEMDKIEIVAETWSGFEENIAGIDAFENLPEPAQNFILKLEKLLGTSILLIGTGPERQAIIVRKS